MGNEEKAVVNEKGECFRENPGDDTPLQRAGGSAEIIEETPPGQCQRREGLVLEIPSQSLEYAREDFVTINLPLTPSHTPKRVNFSPMPSPSFDKTNCSPGPSLSRNRPNLKNLIPRLSFKYRNTTSEIEKAAMLALGCSSAETRGKPCISRTLSLTKLFTPRMKSTSSLPVTPIAHSNPESTHGGNSAKGGVQLPIPRSNSVPVLSKVGSLRQLDSLGSVFRVIPTTPCVTGRTLTMTSDTSPRKDTDGNDDGGDHIPEDEAVCRICLVELGEGADTFKMECSCRGELALAHKECALKWFSIKGNKTCEVCKQDVQNLPVTLLRVQNSRATNAQGNRTWPAEGVRYRVWQDVPVLVIVSMLAYFCFLEQLLVSKMKSGAIAISLPFSCILGLLASMTSTTMVRRKYVWVYATTQFGLVVLAAHLFYTLVHIQAVLSVLLAALVGFGVTMCGTSILGEVLKWRRMWLARSNQQLPSPQATEPDQLPSSTADQTPPPHPNETEIRGSEAGHCS